MSYNISHWKTKEIDGFAVELKTLPGDWRLLEINPTTVTMRPCEGGSITGRVTDEGLLYIGAIYLHGEFSGTYFHDTLRPAFLKSIGKIQFVLIWEDGDTIARYTYENGKETVENVDL